jgi:hypothetical protein
VLQTPVEAAAELERQLIIPEKVEVQEWLSLDMPVLRTEREA